MAHRNRYRRNSRKWFECDALIRNGLSAQLAYDELEHRINKVKPFFFRDTDSDRGGWHDDITARDRLRYEINLVRKELLGQNVPDTPDTPDIPDVPDIPDIEPPKAKTPKERFMYLRDKAREFVKNRDGFDWLNSMRISVNGAQALNQGIPVEFLMASMTAAWSQASRDQFESFAGEYGVTSFDPQTFAQDEREDGQHAAMPLVKRLIQANIPVYLHGGAGTSKSTIARQSAEVMGIGYRETTLAGATPSAIKGRDRLKEFIVSEFTMAYENGEIFCGEELDSADPQVLLVINNALANGTFWNDSEGRAVKRHENFRFVATANTLGTGADSTYTGRERLDGATLDRFRMGRVFVDLDLDLEAKVFDSIISD